MSVISKGYSVTTGYTQILPRGSDKKCLEVINEGTGIVQLVIGPNPVDLNSITIAVGASYTSPVPIWEEINMKASIASDVVIIADGQE